MNTETEDELNNVVSFPERKEGLKDSQVIGREAAFKPFCTHDAVLVNDKERTLRCRRCEALLDPFDYVVSLCDTESRYIENVKYLRREEKQRRQNIEKLIQIERNAKARIRNSGHKAPLPLWQNEKVEL